MRLPEAAITDGMVQQNRHGILPVGRATPMMMPLAGCIVKNRLGGWARLFRATPAGENCLLGLGASEGCDPTISGDRCENWSCQYVTISLQCHFLLLILSIAAGRRTRKRKRLALPAS